MPKLELPEGFTRWKPKKSERQENGLPWNLESYDWVETVFEDGEIQAARVAIDWEWGTKNGDCKLLRSNRIYGYRKVN